MHSRAGFISTLFHKSIGAVITVAPNATSPLAPPLEMLALASQCFLPANAGFKADCTPPVPSQDERAAAQRPQRFLATS